MILTQLLTVLSPSNLVLQYSFSNRIIIAIIVIVISVKFRLVEEISAFFTFLSIGAPVS